MKTILYMAMSIDGYIADRDNKTPWSREEWKSFSKKVKEIKNLVTGRKTFEIMKAQNEFKKIGNPLIVVISRKKSDNKNFIFVKSPEEALQFLKEKGFSRVLLAGGGSLNSSFMQKGLIDEIFLDIEPFVFGGGTKIFSKIAPQTKLQLLSTKKLSKNSFQLHYKILKLD